MTDARREYRPTPDRRQDCIATRAYLEETLSAIDPARAAGVWDAYDRARAAGVEVTGHDG